MMTTFLRSLNIPATRHQTTHPVNDVSILIAGSFLLWGGIINSFYLCLKRICGIKMTPWKNLSSIGYFLIQMKVVSDFKLIVCLGFTAYQPL